MSSRYAKEFHRLKHNLEKKSNGQAFIKDWDPDNITTFIVEVTPRGGPYKQGKFLFQIVVPELYPDVHPDVVCLTDIYHPNIDPDITDEHNICLNLFDEWNKSFGLEDCVQGLIFLLYNPNLMDPISAFFDGSTVSEESFISKVQASLRGESFDGITFIKNPGFGEPEISPKVVESSQDSEKEDGSEKTTKPVSLEEKGAVGLTNGHSSGGRHVKKASLDLEHSEKEPPSSEQMCIPNCATSESVETIEKQNNFPVELTEESVVIGDETTIDLLTSETEEEEMSPSDVDAVICGVVMDVVAAVANESPERDSKLCNRYGDDKVVINFAEFRTATRKDEGEDQVYSNISLSGDSDSENDIIDYDDDDEDNDDDDEDDDDGDGCSFPTDHMPYEELACSWTEEDLDEDHPFMDALGCRFLYQADTSSEEDEDYSTTMEVDNEDDTDWPREVIELNNSRVIIHSCDPSRNILQIVLEEREGPGGVLFPWLRRTLRQVMARVLPFERAIRQANAGFWEVCFLWTMSLWLSGQFPPSRVTRIRRRTCVR